MYFGFKSHFLFIFWLEKLFTTFEFQISLSILTGNLWITWPYLNI